MNKTQLVRRAYRELEGELYSLPPVNLSEVVDELDCATDNLFWALQDIVDEGVAEFLYNCANDLDIAIIALGSTIARKYEHEYWKEAFSLVLDRLKERARRYRSYWQRIEELRYSGQLGEYEP
jgi:hypothetical protein